MLKIRSIKITGFRGDGVVKFSPGPDVNFIIGKNGTGKTTFISMIAAVLQRKFRRLFSVEFDTIEIIFTDGKSRRKPKLIVSKHDEEGDLSFIRVELFTESSSGKPIELRYFDYPHREHDLPDHIEGLELEDPHQVSAKNTHRRVRRRFPPYAHFPNAARLDRVFNGMFRASWLSIHRGSFSDDRATDPGFASSVDQRVSHLENEFPRFLSILDSRSDFEFKRFQENFFLALLYDSSVLRSLKDAQSIKIENEKSGLKRVFESLNLPKSRFEEKVEEHFSVFAQSRKAFFSQMGEKADLDGHLFLALSDTMRIHNIVQKWFEYQATSRKIYLPRENFKEAINRLYERKHVDIDESNSPQIYVEKSGMKRRISLRDLSSGEKQVFILFAEAMLQDRQPWIFLADEPELSLHMDWQLQLVPGVIDINPNCQLILATHSPEIIAEFTDSAVEMEEISSYAN